MHLRPLLAVPAAGLAAGVAVLAFAGPASAHVEITPDTTAAGGYALLTLSVPHGCDGSPTTKLAVQVPEGILSVTPTRSPFYAVKVTREKLAKPVTDSHGNTVTERDAVVTFIARKPLPDHLRDALELSVKLPEKAGETLVFPTIQTCVKGQTAWTERVADGQSEEDLEHPAPAFTLSAADDGATADSADGDEGGDGLGAIGTGTGIAGLALGATALVVARRRP